MRAGYYLDRLRLVSVIRDRPQPVRVGPDHVRQDAPIAGVAPGPRHDMPFPVPGCLQGIHREHHVPGRRQRRHPRAMISLDPDPDLEIVLAVRDAGVLPDQRTQLGHARRALAQPGPLQRPPALVHQLDIMMTGGPVITREQNRHLCSSQ